MLEKLRFKSKRMKGVGDPKLAFPSSVGCIAIGVILFYIGNWGGGVLVILLGCGLAVIGR